MRRLRDQPPFFYAARSPRHSGGATTWHWRPANVLKSLSHKKHKKAQRKWKYISDRGGEGALIGTPFSTFSADSPQ